MASMYRTPSKRQQRLKLAAIYSLMTIGVVSLVTLLVFVMLGYRFNRDTSTIQQGGLVQFASRPVDASVTIGNAKLGDLTPSKITINPGDYAVRMNREGYQEWSKSVSVRPGEVLWLNYAQLVPNDIQTDSLTGFAALSSVKSSPNGDRFAIVEDPARPVLTFLDITSDEPRRTELTIPDALLPEGKTPTFAVADWANDSDRLLVNMSYESTVERLLVDRRDAEKTVSLTKTYEADIAEAIFDPRSSERVITRSSGGDVRIIDTADESLSGVVANSVTSMSLYANDALLLVQAVAEGGQSVGYLSLGSDKVRVLKRIASSDKTLITLAKYFSEPYVAVSTGNQLEIFKLKSLASSESDDPISMSTVVSTTLPATVDYLSIRSGGRFVIAQYGSGVQTYDLELDKQTLTAFDTPVSGELRWLDRYHFYVTTGANLEVMEFDGGNAHTITPLTTQFDAVQSDDGKFIYSINAVDDGFALQRSRMILE
jgi:hypothetical protein